MSEADSTCHYIAIFQSDENYFLQDKSEAGAALLVDDLKQPGQSLGLLG